MNNAEEIEGLRYSIDVHSGDFICGSCGKHFPTHYPLTEHRHGVRKQMGRRWVAGQNNFFRHLKSCQKEAGRLPRRKIENKEKR